MNATSNRYQVSIEADPTLPIIRMTRDFDATPTQLMRAHTDPALFARWVGPNGMEPKILDWDATTGGRWRYVAGRDGEEYGFHGCFHEVGEDRIVQTFTFDGQPDGVALETLRQEPSHPGNDHVAAVYRRQGGTPMRRSVHGGGNGDYVILWSCSVSNVVARIGRSGATVASGRGLPPDLL